MKCFNHTPLALTLIAMTSGVATSETMAMPTLEEVIVTAQKRAQSLRDVPVSVAVTSGEAIEKQNLGNLEAVSSRLPNIKITKGPVGDQLFIRGVGSGKNGGFEQSVGTFVDGVYRGRARASRGTLFDVERVEVLRGPQSTFFGNNSIAGAFNVSTRKPGTEFEARVAALYEPEDEEYSLELTGGGPLTDTLGIRLAAKLSGADGFYENTVTGDGTPDFNSQLGRVVLAWNPSDALEVNYKFEGEELSGRGLLPFQAIGCPTAAGFPDTQPSLPGNDGPLCVATRFDPGGDPEFVANLDDREDSNMAAKDNSNRFREHVLTLNLDWKEHTLTSVTAYTEFEFDSYEDSDSLPVNALLVRFGEEFEQYSQELRVTSPEDSQISYIVGIYGQHNEFTTINQVGGAGALNSFAGTPFEPYLTPVNPFGFRNMLSQEEDTVSVFGSLTWNIASHLRTTVGMRWVDVSKTGDKVFSHGTIDNPTRITGGITPFSGQPLMVPCSVLGVPDCDPQTPFMVPVDLNQVPTPIGVPHNVVNLKKDDDDVSVSFNIQYDLTDEFMGYFTYSEGFKAGGIDAQNIDGVASELTFDPEEVEAMELGFKATWLDNRLSTNVAVFSNEFTNLQRSLLSGNGFGFNVDNAAESKIEGLELEAAFQATENLTAKLSFSILDAKYESYKVGGCTIEQLVTAEGPCIQDLSGKRLPYAADYSGNLHLLYERPVFDNLIFTADLNLFFTDEMDTAEDSDPNLIQDAYHKVDLRLGLGSADGTWDMAIVGKNLNDEQTFTGGDDLPLQPGNFFVLTERPRSIALQASYNW